MKKDYFEYIMDYAAGELSPEKEDELFLALNSDADLREEFRNYMSLRRTTTAARESFAPPASSTMEIFGRLGIGSAAGSEGWLARAGGMISANKKIIIGSLAAAALTALMFVMFYNPKDAIPKPTTAAVSSKNINNEIADKASETTKARIPISNENIAKNTVVEGESKYVRTSPDKANNNTQADIDKKDSEPNIARAGLSSPYIDPVVSLPAMNKWKSGGIAQEKIESKVLAWHPNRFFAVGSLAGSMFLPPEQLAASNAASMGDISGAIFWEPIDGLALGLEMRRDHFGQIRLLDRYGEYTEDLAVMNVYSLALRITNRSGEVMPYGQFSIGTAEGPVLRVESGLKYSIIQNWEIALAVEYSHLFYDNIDGVTRHSKKLGLNFDLIYNFEL
jgi:hypothetical protein